VHLQNGNNAEGKADLLKVVELAPTSQEATDAKPLLDALK
jgi:hypothetical protein